jgi:hypothetical protein
LRESTQSFTIISMDNNIDILDTDFSVGIQHFVRRGVEYRLVSAQENIYEYNRLFTSKGERARKFSEAGIADGFVEIGKDGQPTNSWISYVVLDQHIEQDSKFLQNLQETALQNRDYHYYQGALYALRALDRINIVTQGKVIEAMSSGRRFRIQFSEDVIVHDRAEEELFSYADVVVSGHFYNHVEIKVDMNGKRAYLYDGKFGKSEIAELPIHSIIDISHPEQLVKQQLKNMAILSQKIEKEEKETLAFEPIQQEDSTTTVKQEVLIDSPKKDDSKSLEKEIETELKRLDVDDRSENKTDLQEPVVELGARFVHEDVPIVKISGASTDELSSVVKKTIPIKERLGELTQLFENKRKNGNVERAFELAHGKARVVFIYSPNGDIEVDSVQSTDFVYPWVELSLDWEKQVDMARKKAGKFTSEKREEDLIFAKREIIDVARSVNTYKKIIDVLPKNRKEIEAIRNSMDKIIKNTKEKYGNVFKQEKPIK